MNEAETRAELIDPALAAAGWGKVDGSRVRREVIAPGRLQGSGQKRSKSTIADYVLVYKNTKLAVIEAKRSDLSVTEGVRQAKTDAEKLQTRFTFSSNGLDIYQIDMQTGKEGLVEKFPAPDELWDLTFSEHNEWRERFMAIPFEDKGGSWEARYYQHNAINKTLEAIVDNQQRILLTLATGTGKTFIAFQLAWKLFHSRWSLKRDAKRLPRILFLADRNILADQAFNSFSAFSEDALIRIDPSDIRKKGRVPKNGSIFFTIFQTFMSGPDETPYFGEYTKDFFDFIIIDECHRGGANDESSWREILNHFSPAVQLGLTATPKRKDNVDTYSYFGEPVYTYSLKEGINDGYLTPFRLKQIVSTMDEYIYSPGDGVVVEGDVEEGRVYTEGDFNRIIKIPVREQKRVEEFMGKINQNEKTLVFCATQEHAGEVRDFINQIKTSTNPNYCVRVTANDGKAGEQYLREFQDNEKLIPTILTTSRKLSTGVDARNIRNIVLMRQCKNMIEFKQIIGRGTRLFDDKDYFTIYDFVKAYENFNNPEWDGEPLEPEPTTGGGGDDGGTDGGGDPLPEPPKAKLKIKLSDGRSRLIRHVSVTTFWGPDGVPISAAQFLELLFGELPVFFTNEDELREIWSMPDTRQKLLGELEEKGFGSEQLDEMKEIIDATESDIFDVLAFVAFAESPITRQERVINHKGDIFSHYDYKQHEFIDFVLAQYVKGGVGELAEDKLSSLLDLRYHNVSDAVAELGVPAKIRDVFIGFQKYLYE